MGGARRLSPFSTNQPPGSFRVSTVFGETLAGSNPDQLLASFVLPPQMFDTRNEDSGFEATVKGEFDLLPGGKTQILIGASSRRSELAYSHQRHARARYSPVTVGAGLGVFPRDTHAIGNEDLDLTGIDGAVVVDNDNAKLSSDMSVESAFAEFQVPLLADLPLVHRLSVNAAVRHEDTSQYGSDTTWSIGGVWNVTPDLRLRARKGTSFSAPTLKQATLPTRIRPIPFFVDTRDGGFRFLCLPFPPPTSSPTACSVWRKACASTSGSAISPTRTPSGRRQCWTRGSPLPRTQDDLTRIPQGRYDSRRQVYYAELVHTF